MATIQRIDDERTARALADLLNGSTRRRPVVVVTIPAARTEPWIDVEEIAREAGALADVYLMPTGAFTWEFSHRMADGTQVYGGAGRVYPVGHEWATDLSRSPLRFAFDAAEGERATQHLISDMLRMAAGAGLLQIVPTRTLRKVAGSVRWIVAGRALVDVGGAFPAAVAEELTLESVPIARILSPGQRVEGWLDPETKRIDVTKSLRPSTDALAGYAVGDVVLARAAMVRNGKAELVLYPKTSTPAVVVPVLRADVTSNPADDLRTLMTVGEVIAARVVETGPRWRLVLNDVDDDEPIVAAPSLLTGGPPWLVEEPEVGGSEDLPRLAPPSPRMPSAAPLATAPAPQEPEPTPVAAPRPSPMMLDRGRPRPAPSSPGPTPAEPVPAAVSPASAGAAPSETTRALLLKIDGLNAEVAGLKRDMASLRDEVDAGINERDQLRYLMDQAERRANKAEHDLKAARARLRKSNLSRPESSSLDRGPRFADAEAGFRHLVLTQWATRTDPSEQHARPLGNYVIGPDFLESLRRLEGISEHKVADVVFEIVTGLAPRMASREVHHLRTGTGGDDPVRRRSDGAVAWRASLQVNTPSARRIHYWELRNGDFELAKVSTHDDFDA